MMQVTGSIPEAKISELMKIIAETEDLKEKVQCFEIKYKYIFPTGGTYEVYLNALSGCDLIRKVLTNIGFYER
jgi:hypothetical protein